MNDENFGLTKEQVRQYHAQGWLGPFTLISEDEMAIVRTLHYSPPNKSETRRFGITPRLTVPFVEIGNRDKIDVLMLKGEDYMGDYHIVEPPSR